MTIKARQVKDKKDEYGRFTGKPGTVYDVFLRITTPDGVQSYGKRGFITKANAAIHEAEMRTQLSMPGFVPPKAAEEKRLLKDYLTSWIEIYGNANLRPSTIASYKSTINNHIIPNIGNVHLVQLTPEMLDRLFAKLAEEGLSPTTVKYVQRVLSVSLESARKYGTIKTNPANNIITKFKTNPKVPDPYTIEQMRMLLSHAIGTNWQMIVLLSGMYGLRRGEVLGLRWDNVDLENRVFSVCEQLPFKIPAGTKMLAEMAPTKSHDRELPITDSTYPFFVEQKKLYDNHKKLAEISGAKFYDNRLVISRPDGTVVVPSNMSSDFGSFLRRTKMPHIRFHDLRHTAATNMHQLTGDFYTVSQILGHTLKGIGIQLGISGNLDSVTAQYVDVRLERKMAVLSAYHDAVLPEAIRAIAEKSEKKNDDRGER